MSISAGDYQNLLDFVGLLYSISERNELLHTVCEWLQETLRLSSLVLVPANPLTGQFQFERGFVVDSQPKDLLQYVLYYAPLDPLATNKWILRYDNTATRYTDFVSPLQLADSEFGRDFLSRIPMFYCLCATLGSQGDPIGALGLHRKRGCRDFTVREKEILRLLAPHLSRALHNLNLLESFSACQGAGMIVVGADGRPSFINQEARRALNGHPITTIPDPGLSAGGAQFTTETGVYRVKSIPLIAGAASPLGEEITSTINLRSRHRRRSKLFLLEPLPSQSTLMSKLDRFDLSKRQKEIATLVLQGHSNRDIADKLCICEQTVKDHLHDIFEKVRVNRRGELVAKILEISQTQAE